jgi:hypothetical protein
MSEKDRQHQILDDVDWIPALDDFVARQHAAFCELGGSAKIDPYLLLFVTTKRAIKRAQDRGTNVSLTICVLRPDGTFGVIDLTEVFARKGLILDVRKS